MSERHSRSLSEQFAKTALRVAELVGQDNATTPGHFGKEKPASTQDPAVSDYTYRALRHWGLAQVRLKRMASRRPPVSIEALLAVAWSALNENVREPHVIVSQAVESAKALGSPADAKFVNALLRKTLAEPDSSARDFENPVARYNAPAWWLEKINRDHPQQAQPILEALCMRPPLTVRLLPSAWTAASFSQKLREVNCRAIVLGEHAVAIDPPLNVSDIEGFAKGTVSVQDFAAQHAHRLFEFSSQTQTPDILDACAAPGGKSIALAQTYRARIWSMDVSRGRLNSLRADLARVGPTLLGSIHPVEADVLDPDGWPEALRGLQFDGILLDAPCSASGVVRRHPEIAWRRTREQVDRAAQIQHDMLDVLWKRLRPGGQLVFVTCSVFIQEGESQERDFLARTPDAVPCASPGRIMPACRPSEGIDQDGFFYAKFKKINLPA